MTMSNLGKLTSSGHAVLVVLVAGHEVLFLVQVLHILIHESGDWLHCRPCASVCDRGGCGCGAAESPGYFRYL